jgi:hypothetical protein
MQDAHPNDRNNPIKHKLMKGGFLGSEFALREATAATLHAADVFNGLNLSFQRRMFKFITYLPPIVVKIGTMMTLNLYPQTIHTRYI